MKCKVPGCKCDTEEDIEKTAKTGEHLQLLGFHVDAVDPKTEPQQAVAVTHAPTATRMEKIQCPKLELKGGSSTDEQWGQYKTMVNIAGLETKNLAVGLGAEVVGLVFHRLGKETYEALTEDNLLKEAKQLVVKSRNKLVHEGY